MGNFTIKFKSVVFFFKIMNYRINVLELTCYAKRLMFSMKWPPETGGGLQYFTGDFKNPYFDFFMYLKNSLSGEITSESFSLKVFLYASMVFKK